MLTKGVCLQLSKALKQQLKAIANSESYWSLLYLPTHISVYNVHTRTRV